MNTKSVPLAEMIAENRGWLRQMRELLAHVSEEKYTMATGPFSRGGVGKHIRHILEHYGSLLDQLPNTIDYDTRRRDPRIEQSPEAARAWIDSLVKKLDALSGGDAVPETLQVSFRGDEAGQHVDSSVERELMFLSSHTVHHLALVRFILEYLGVEVPDELGVAPSTLRYEANSA